MLRNDNHRSRFTTAVLASLVFHAGIASMLRDGGARHDAGGRPIVVDWIASGPMAGGDTPATRRASRERARRRSAHATPAALREPKKEPRKEDGLASATTPDANGAGTGNAYAESDVDVPARPLTVPRPRYPPGMSREGREGDVVLFLLVDENGRVASEAVSISAGADFDQAALEAVRALRFSPAEKGGANVRVRIHWTCRFRLDS